MNLTRQVFTRLLQTIPVVLGVSALVFFLLRMVPGDPVEVFYGLEISDPKQLAEIRASLGLDRPLVVQFVQFVERAAGGDLGRSLLTRRPVLPDVLDRLGNTVQLAAAAISIAVVLGMALGLVAAARPGGWWDHLSLTISLVGVSLPVFWLGLMLMWLMAVHLRLLPATGTGTLAHLVLPALTMSAASVALISRIVRASVLEEAKKDYVRTARGKGLSEAGMLLRHVVPNALLPVVTVVGLQFGYMMAGAVLTETVFGWPGLGRLLVDAIKARDYPVVQGAVLVVAITFVLVNLAVDVLYVIINPRLREGEAE